MSDEAGDIIELAVPVAVPVVVPTETPPVTVADAGAALHRDNFTTPAEKANQHTVITGAGIPESTRV